MPGNLSKGKTDSFTNTFDFVLGFKLNSFMKVVKEDIADEIFVYDDTTATKNIVC